jgi:hypothetical protein
LPDGNTLITDGRDEADVDSEEIEVYLESSARLQIHFFDAYGGLMFEDLAKSPMGQIFTGSNDWTADSFEIRAPRHVAYGELRLFLNNRGRAFIKNVMATKL